MMIIDEIADLNSKDIERVYKLLEPQLKQLKKEGKLFVCST